MNFNPNLTLEIFSHAVTIDSHATLYSRQLDAFDHVEDLGPIAMLETSRQTISNMPLPLYKPCFTNIFAVKAKMTELKFLGRNIKKLYGNLKKVQGLFTQTLPGQLCYLNLLLRLEQVREKYLQQTSMYDKYLTDAEEYKKVKG